MPNIIEITDFSAPELDVSARLTQQRKTGTKMRTVWPEW